MRKETIEYMKKLLEEMHEENVRIQLDNKRLTKLLQSCFCPRKTLFQHGCQCGGE